MLRSREMKIIQKRIIRAANAVTIFAKKTNIRDAGRRAKKRKNEYSRNVGAAAGNA